MRKLLIALLAAIPLTVLAATPKTVTLAVQNMTCELCPITVKKSLEKVPGVSAVKVDFDRKTAIVTYDADKAQPEALTKGSSQNSDRKVLQGLPHESQTESPPP